MCSENTTWTMTRDASLGLNFSVVNYYDGQGMMVPKSLGVTSGTELDGANVCTQTGTTTELNITDYFRMNNMSINMLLTKMQQTLLQHTAKVDVMFIQLINRCCSTKIKIIKPR